MIIEWAPRSIASAAIVGPQLINVLFRDKAKTRTTQMLTTASAGGRPTQPLDRGPNHSSTTKAMGDKRTATGSSAMLSIGCGLKTVYEGSPVVVVVPPRTF